MSKRQRCGRGEARNGESRLPDVARASVPQCYSPCRRQGYDRSIVRAGRTGFFVILHSSFFILGYAGNVVSRLSSTAAPIVKW